MAHGTRHFNPRARVGRDTATFAELYAKWTFQSARLVLFREQINGGLFQSTRPRGARPVWHGGDEQSFLFQSTRPRGARPWHRRVQGCIVLISIHAPAWGATPLIHVARAQFLFQSTRPRGARLYRAIPKSMSKKFQSTRPRGARLWA